jgi:hypothetical protein
MTMSHTYEENANATFPEQRYAGMAYFSGDALPEVQTFLRYKNA